MSNHEQVQSAVLTRRGFLVGVPAAAVGASILESAWGTSAQAQDSPAAWQKPYPEFPQADPKLAQEMVGVCHVNEARVRELVEAKPELVNAVWDWGFGDYETALGAAAHTGQRGIAEFLLQRGARLDIFAATMLGMTDAVKAMVTTMPGIQKTLGPHGITLLSHARAGGERATATLAYLESLGDADRGVAVRELSAEEKEIYLGKYPFGSGTEDRILLKLGNGGDLQLAIGKSSARRLNNIGEHEFSPAGSASVRVQFVVEAGKAESVTITDGKIVLAANRKGT